MKQSTQILTLKIEMSGLVDIYPNYINTCASRIRLYTVHIHACRPTNRKLNSLHKVVGATCTLNECTHKSIPTFVVFL